MSEFCISSNFDIKLLVDKQEGFCEKFFDKTRRGRAPLAAVTNHTTEMKQTHDPTQKDRQ